MCRFEKIEIFLFDEFESLLLQNLQESMKRIFKIDVNVKGKLPKPKAYDPRRNQFWAKPFLEALLPYLRPGSIALGITEEDLFEEGLNFVFGEASMVVPVAVVATRRLHNRFYGLNEDEDLFFERLLKECNHEVGHTLGLEHCLDPSCVMHFSNSLLDTDKKSPNFCQNCWEKAKKVLCIRY